MRSSVITVKSQKRKISLHPDVEAMGDLTYYKPPFPVYLKTSFYSLFWFALGSFMVITAQGTKYGYLHYNIFKDVGLLDGSSFSLGLLSSAFFSLKNSSAKTGTDTTRADVG